MTGHRDITEATPAFTDFSAYLKSAVTCPAGGIGATFASSYTLGNVDSKPTCRIVTATHVLPADTTG